MNSKWNQFDIEKKIIGIVQEAHIHAPDHHFGRPFLSAYQLAIEFDRRHPEVARDLGYAVGGRGIDAPNSLAQYLAQQLSQRIHAGQLPQIQGALLSDQHVLSMAFQHQGTTIESSLAKTGIALSLFRYVE